MEYCLIESLKKENLIKFVNTRLYDGWRAQGGICIHVSGDVTTYIQAMIKE